MTNSKPSPAPDPQSIPLREYHLPEPVSWWPPAVGWWLLAILVLLGTALLFIFLRYHKNQRWRRSSRQHLATLQAEFNKDMDSHVLAENISILLRRICLTRFPAHKNSHLTGEKWLAYLDSCTTNDKPFFQTDIGRQLITAAYDPNAQIDGEQLLKTCRKWLSALPGYWWRNNV